MLATLAIVFVVGLVLGLVVLGWGVWPVQWSGNARPADLDEAWQANYLAMTADSFAFTGDAVAAQERVQALVSSKRTMAQIAQDLRALADERTAAGDTEGAKRVLALAGVAGAPLPEVSPTGAPAATPVSRPAQEPLQSRFLRVLGLAVLVLVILAGLLLLVYFLQSRTVTEAPAEETRLAPATAAAHTGTAATPAVASEPRPAVVSAPPVAPVAQAPLTPPPQTAALGPFVATYNLGDIDFDMSFGIESSSGDFLGECGLGMAEVIGGGDTQRVTAFEVWLFDKTDIRTVAIVLASNHAYNDAALRTKLASRGEIVLAQPGQVFSVKTSSLKLEGRILDLAYGGGDVPPQSYFTAFSVELSPMPITGEA